jgi:hypothetical protein
MHRLFLNLCSIFKIGCRPLRNDELRTKLLRIYRDKSRKGCEVNRRLSAPYFFSLNFRVNALFNRFLLKSESYNRTQVLILLLVGAIFPAYSCDVCGGVSGSSSIGLLAANRFHTVGYRSQYRLFSSYLEGIRHSQEHLWTQELNFRIQPHERLQIFGQIPFHVNQQVRDFGADLVTGLGDPQFVLNGILLHQKDSAGLTKHFLSVGTGLKFPLGKNTIYSNPLKNLFPGSGAFDVPIMSQYTLGVGRKSALVTEYSYTVRGTDKHGFHFGNAGGLSSIFVQNNYWQGFRLLTGIGLQYEHFGASRQIGQDLTGRNNAGEIFSVRANIMLLTYRWLWGIQFQRAIWQEVNGGMTKQKMICNVQLNYLITKEK